MASSTVTGVVIDALTVIELWITRISIFMAVLLMGPTAILIAYDIAVYIWRTADSSASELVLNLRSSSSLSSPIPSSTSSSSSSSPHILTTPVPISNATPAAPANPAWHKQASAVQFYRKLIIKRQPSPSKQAITASAAATTTTSSSSSSSTFCATSSVSSFDTTTVMVTGIDQLPGDHASTVRIRQGH
ncbi:hypothetical protein V1514DRAFT_352216 [Lipomyces japonicus]|uniref:uncharacterized protein n=1 Tax=Lipomyces japonicus TaxID=56871 RepID=UPI0034CE8F94